MRCVQKISRVKLHLSRQKLTMKYVLLNSTCCKGGARGVMVIVIGNGHGDTSSNPG